MDLWIVGKYTGEFTNCSGKEYRSWEFCGVFDSEQKAIDRCLDDKHFVGPIKLNESINTEEPVEWPCSFFPKECIDDSTT